MATLPAETERLLREVVNEMRRRREVEAEFRDDQRWLMQMLLSPEDRRFGRVLLPLAAELVGSNRFTAASLLATSINNRTALGEAARDKLDEMATATGGLRAFGKLLSRLEGVPLNGCRLVSAGECSEGLRWRLEWVSGGD